MAWPGDRWTPSGGYCTDIKIGESVVSFIAAGNGDYARDQRPPVGYERAELEEIASRLVRETEDSGDRSRYGKLPGGHFRADCFLGDIIARKRKRTTSEIRVWYGNEESRFGAALRSSLPLARRWSEMHSICEVCVHCQEAACLQGWEDVTDTAICDTFEEVA